MTLDRPRDGRDEPDRPDGRQVSDWSSRDLPPDHPSTQDRAEHTAEIDRIRALADAEEAEADEPARKPDSDRGWQTITDEIGETRSWRSFRDARRELGTVPGTQLHHIVEQSQQKPERSGFTAEQVNTSDNITRMPIDIHNNISARYSRGIPGYSQMRDSLNGEPWEYQYKFGCRVVDEETRRARGGDA